MNKLTLASKFSKRNFVTSTNRILSREVKPNNFILMEKSVMLIRFKFGFNFVHSKQLIDQKT